MDIKIDRHTVVVFDLDDTLYNEIGFLKSAYKFISNQIDSRNSESLYSNMLAMYRNGRDVFEYLAEKYIVEKQDLIHTYRNHIPDISLFEGVFEIFQNITKKEGRLAIITDGRVNTQTAKIEALGIKEFLSKIVISEAIGSEKPNELNYRAVETALPAKTYYYIGDNIKKDFLTPNKIGWKTIGLIDNGLNIHYQLNEDLKDEFLPQFLIHSFKDINII
ncbi:HAD family hydrolase [Winogradskyella sp.]|uniref:HAD family hydrolase n=1 Tax=Winogradskyella sp. TaxID=1883156 RepID=UPI002607B343|nr:HAD family hydrolase [Winogradskyella sp.]